MPSDNILIQRVLIKLAMQAKRLEASYYEFFKAAWHVLEPQTPFKDNWHIELLCNELQEIVTRVALRQSKQYDLCINISPRTLKSLIVSVMLCPWAWTRWPHLRFINSSYEGSLSTEHNVKSRDLIESDWYRMRWGDVFKMKTDQNVKTHFENDKGGARYSTSVEGSITGKGADVIAFDDPVDPMEARSKVKLSNANVYYDQTLSNRLNDPSVGVRIIVMQRVNINDVTGHVEKKYAGTFKFIVIPAELAGVKPKPIELIQKYQGGLFFANRFTRAVLDSLRKVGETYYAGQYLQSPSPTEGTILKRDNWKYYTQLPKKFDKVIQSWDMNMKAPKDKKKNKNSYACCEVWGKLGADVYLIYLWKAKLDFVPVLENFLRITAMYPQARMKLVEDKANGPAVMSTLEHKIPGIKPMDPKAAGGDKQARMQAVSYVQEGGNAYLPDPSLQGWVEGFVERCAMFPNIDENDEIDAMSQAWYFLYGGDDPIARMKRIVGNIF